MQTRPFNKTRTLVSAQAVATATATAYPTFPTGPTAGKVLYAGDMQGALIAGFRWTMADLAGFTAADAKIQTSDDGTTWEDLVSFPQQTVDGTKTVWLYDTDPRPLRFVRALIDMTGTPGTSTHTVKVFYAQLEARGSYAPPGMVDRHTG